MSRHPPHHAICHISAVTKTATRSAVCEMAHACLLFLRAPVGLKPWIAAFSRLPAKRLNWTSSIASSASERATSCCMHPRQKCNLTKTILFRRMNLNPMVACRRVLVTAQNTCLIDTLGTRKLACRKSALALASARRMRVSRRCRLGARPATVLVPSRLALKQKLCSACKHS